MPLSQSPIVKIIANIFGTIWVFFGINAILRPDAGLAMFPFEAPTSPRDKKLVDDLMIIYGARDIFVGLAVYFTSYFGERKALGWITIAASMLAYVDGAVMWENGDGQWNHWGYAPMLTATGVVLLGAFDGSVKKEKLKN